MLRFFIGLSLVWTAVPTILSDTGCHCALVKNVNTTPSASSTVSVGCSYKMDWTGTSSKWCLTDQTVSACGTNQTSFGVVDSCAVARFTSVMLTPAPQLTWYQSNSTFFTGQNLTVNWTSQNILSDEPIKISYLRTTLTSVGNNALEFYTGRISDSVNSLATNTFLILSATTSPSVTANGTQLFSVSQSSVTGAQVINNGTIVTTGTSVMILGQNLTVNWTGVGQASLGVATVTIKSFGGGGGGGGTTVGTPVTNIPVQTNNTIVYLLPRSFVPGFGGTQYSATISILSPGATTPYTGTSSSFSLAAAPTNTASSTTTHTATPTASVSFGSSQSSTPSVTPTISLTNTASLTPTQTPTPTPSLSFGASPSTSSPPSASNSPSISMSSSISLTLTSTASPTPPIDVGAIAAAASQAASANLGAILGGVLGGIAGIAVLSIIGYRYHQRQVLIQKRKRATVVSQRMADVGRLYGVHIDNPGVQPIDRAYRAGRLPRQNSRNRNGS